MKKVAIITRTKDRPIMLERAYESITHQTLQDFAWVVVNDGGTVPEVQSIVERAQAAGIEVVVIHHEQSKGMEGASNAGIEASHSEYLVIHDDDDSWDPSFLERTVAFLEGGSGPGQCMGVVTRSIAVTEIIRAMEVKILRRRPYNPDLNLLTLADVIGMSKLPPPISFLYRRELLDYVGLYDPLLPVLGDWDFLLRVVSKYEVGVIEDALANYHLRPSISMGTYGNTILAKKDVHKTWQPYIIDKYLKKDLAEGRQGLGHLLLLSRDLRSIDFDLYSVRRLSRFLQGLRDRLESFYFGLKNSLS